MQNTFFGLTTFVVLARCITSTVEKSSVICKESKEIDGALIGNHFQFPWEIWQHTEYANHSFAKNTNLHTRYSTIWFIDVI